MKCPSNQRRTRGFTLVEILIALSILTVVMVMISQAIGLVSQTWRKGMARADNFSQARSILNLVNRDLQSIVLRPDLAAFVDENGNPSFTFYSKVNGSTGTRRLSLVEYSLNTKTPPVFERNDVGLSFPLATKTLSLGTTNKLPEAANLAEDNAQPLSEGILIFEWQTLDSTGKLQDTYNASSTRAIVVSLLVLDSEAFRMADKQGKLSSIRATFGTAPSPAETQTYSQHWLAILNTTDFGSDLSPQIRTGIRAFERYIPLPTKPTY